MPSRSVRVVPGGKTSCFLWLSDIPEHVRTPLLSPLIRRRAPRLLPRLGVLAVVSNAAGNVGAHVFSSCFSFLQVNTQRCGRSWAPWQFWFYVFEAPPRGVPQRPHPSAAPPAGREGPVSPRPGQRLCVVDAGTVALQTGVRWDPIVVLVCISLTISDVEHFSSVCWPPV